VVPEDTVAFAVERACTSGAMVFASGPEEAALLVTAWHTPPETPSQEPSLCEPRGSGDTDGSVAVAALVTFPVQTAWPSQVIAAPAAEAADGSATSRAVFIGCPCPDRDWAASSCAAPGPVEAFETDCTWQPPVPPAHDAVPVEVRGFPPATAPSHAAELVCRVPLQPAGQSSAALEDDVDDGPLVGCPLTGSPVAGSIIT
jgi:hypothetical protein